MLRRHFIAFEFVGECLAESDPTAEGIQWVETAERDQLARGHLPLPPAKRHAVERMPLRRQAEDPVGRDRQVAHRRIERRRQRPPHQQPVRLTRERATQLADRERFKSCQQIVRRGQHAEDRVLGIGHQLTRGDRLLDMRAAGEVPSPTGASRPMGRPHGTRDVMTDSVAHREH